jgi:putative oxidoreductase
MCKFQSAGTLVGRILLALIFIVSGLTRFPEFSKTAEFVAEQGVVLAPLMLAIATVLELAGGIGLMLGFQTRLSALALIVFMVPVTLIMHDFWQFEGQEQTQEIINFMKNLTITGGLVFVLASGGGGWSLDARRAPHPGRS